MPAHHPDPALLLAWASGSGDPAGDLVVATHLALCPDCRRQTRALEALGGGLLLATAPAPAPALDAVLARLEAPAPAPAPRRGGDPRIPEPLRSVVGPLHALAWHVQDDAKVAALDHGARLACLEPGLEIPRHTHRGRELILVLTGAFEDGTAAYARGDVSVADDEIAHHLRVLPGESCLALVVRDAPIHDPETGDALPGY